MQKRVPIDFNNFSRELDDNQEEMEDEPAINQHGYEPFEAWRDRRDDALRRINLDQVRSNFGMHQRKDYRLPGHQTLDRPTSSGSTRWRGQRVFKHATTVDTGAQHAKIRGRAQTKHIDGIEKCWVSSGGGAMLLIKAIGTEGDDGILT